MNQDKYQKYNLCCSQPQGKVTSLIRDAAATVAGAGRGAAQDAPHSVDSKRWKNIMVLLEYTQLQDSFTREDLYL